MKTQKHKPATALLLLILLSCSDGINDRLEGKWQLQQVETEGRREKADTLFYNFQTSLFMYQIYHPDVDTFSHCYGFKVLETNNQVKLELTGYSISLSKFLPQTDWPAAQRRFRIEQITDNRLVLQSEEKRYTFRRF
ncbi:MAG: lipocalin-like domain-containing protein [Tannerellaceae bacterium]|nr:lipocalin-like domain-containing protein [Tannerellaceae bacterium]